MKSLAVIQLGGKQYAVREGDIFRTEKCDAKVGDAFEATEVLLAAQKGETRVGTPYLEGVSVKLQIAAEGRADKVRVFKMKAKKRYRRNKGHRQPYMDVKVLGIAL